MDTTAFFTELRAEFDGDPATTPPRDPRWAELVQQVTGFTGPNELVALNVAARVLPDDECYLEVGTFKGRSIVAAAQGNEAKTLVAMENFMEFGMAGQEARAELRGNIDRFAGGAHIDLLEGDCFTLMATSCTLSKPVGVYFYDGEHTVLAHYLALAVAEPLLADEALVLVDDASWPVVQRAHRMFIKRHPGWRVEQRWDVDAADDPLWSNGLHALVFRRTGAVRPLSRSDQALRVYQTRVQDRLNAVGWAAAKKFPGPVKALAGLVMGRSRSIGDDHRGD